MAKITYKTMTAAEIKSNNADTKTTLTNNISPFKEGLTLTVTKIAYQQRIEDGNTTDTTICGFETNLGFIAIRSLYRERYNKDFKPVQITGKLNNELLDIANKNIGKSDAEVAKLMLAVAKKQTWTIHRHAYLANGKFGVYPATIINLD